MGKEHLDAILENSTLAFQAQRAQDPRDSRSLSSHHDSDTPSEDEGTEEDRSSDEDESDDENVASDDDQVVLENMIDDEENEDEYPLQVSIVDSPLPTPSSSASALPLKSATPSEPRGASVMEVDPADDTLGLSFSARRVSFQDAIDIAESPMIDDEAPSHSDSFPKTNGHHDMDDMSTHHDSPDPGPSPLTDPPEHELSPHPRKRKRLEPSVDDQEFSSPANAADEDEDEVLAAEMEAEDSGSDGGELDGLGQDADVPLEDLLRQYGYVPRDVDDEGGVEEDEEDEERHSEVEGASPPQFGDNEVPETPGADAEHPEAMLTERDMVLDSEPPASPPPFNRDTLLPLPPARHSATTSSPQNPTSFPLLRDTLPVIDSPASMTTKSLDLAHSVRGSEEPELGGYPNGDFSVDSPREEAKRDATDGSSEDEDEDDVDADVDIPSLAQLVSVGEDDDTLKPPFLLRGTLRPYQQAGMEWLVSLYLNEHNGILADEMGLGKTIQTIALLAWLACEKGIWGPHLIIVPTSVLKNWEMEFKKFLPGFKIMTYYGTVRERKERRHGWKAPNAFHVCITSYQLILTDQRIFRRMPWVYMILDEAHNIKNFKSQRWQDLFTFRPHRRLLLTGTPLQVRSIYYLLDCAHT